MRLTHHISRTVYASLLCGITFTLAGCGSLNVQMQVLNPSVVRAFLDGELIRKLLPQIVGSTPESLRNQVDQLKEQHKAAYVRLADTYRNEAQKLAAEPKAKLLRRADDLQADFAVNAQQHALYEALRRDLVNYAENIRRLAGPNGLVSGNGNYTKALYALGVWQQRVAQAEKVISEDIRSAGVSLRSELIGANAQANIQNVIGGSTALVQSELPQISIQNSPVAFVVASASDQSWALRYNQVLSSSKGGSSDVAIRLDSRTGNYLLKGLSFDPSDVAAVAAKVTSQALLLAAQTAGVPVKTTSTQVDGSAKALATSSGALADAQATMAVGRAQEEARRISLLSLAQTIVGEEGDLAGDDARRRAAMAAIRNALDRRLVLIRPTSP